MEQEMNRWFGAASVVMQAPLLKVLHHLYVKSCPCLTQIVKPPVSGVDVSSKCQHPKSLKWKNDGVEKWKEKMDRVGEALSKSTMGLSLGSFCCANFIPAMQVVGLYTCWLHSRSHGVHRYRRHTTHAFVTQVTICTNIVYCMEDGTFSYFFWSEKMNFETFKSCEWKNWKRSEYYLCSNDQIIFG